MRARCCNLPHTSIPPILTISARPLARLLARSFNAPFDVVKSRFQSQLPGERTYRYTLPSLATIYAR